MKIFSYFLDFLFLALKPYPLGILLKMNQILIQAIKVKKFGFSYDRLWDHCAESIPVKSIAKCQHFSFQRNKIMGKSNIFYEFWQVVITFRFFGSEEFWHFLVILYIFRIDYLTFYLKRHILAQFIKFVARNTQKQGVERFHWLT